MATNTRHIFNLSIFNEAALQPIQSEPARKCTAWARPSRAFAVHNRLVFKARFATMLSSGIEQGGGLHASSNGCLFHERGEIRGRSFENQAFRASGLNLVVRTIVHWNTRLPHHFNILGCKLWHILFWCEKSSRTTNRKYTCRKSS